MKRVNWPIFFLGVLWWYAETKYFGWNLVPGSVLELFADGMALAFYAAAFLWRPITVIVIGTHQGAGGGG